MAGDAGHFGIVERADAHLIVGSSKRNVVLMHDKSSPCAGMLSPQMPTSPYSSAARIPALRYARPLDPGGESDPTQPAPALDRMLRALAVGREAQELPLHRIDMGEVFRDVMVAATLTGDQMETALRERFGQTCAAEMNCRSEFLTARIARARTERADRISNRRMRSPLALRPRGGTQQRNATSSIGPMRMLPVDDKR